MPIPAWFHGFSKARSHVSSRTAELMPNGEPRPPEAFSSSCLCQLHVDRSDGSVIQLGRYVRPRLPSMTLLAKNTNDTLPIRAVPHRHAGSIAVSMIMEQHLMPDAVTAMTTNAIAFVLGILAPLALSGWLVFLH